MKIMAGGALNHRKPRPAPTSAPLNSQFARARDKWHKKVVGEHDIADKIGDEAKLAAAIITGTMAIHRGHQ